MRNNELTIQVDDPKAIAKGLRNFSELWSAETANAVTEGIIGVVGLLPDPSEVASAASDAGSVIGLRAAPQMPFAAAADANVEGNLDASSSGVVSRQQVLREGLAELFGGHWVERHLNASTRGMRGPEAVLTFDLNIGLASLLRVLDAPRMSDLKSQQSPTLTGKADYKKQMTTFLEKKMPISALQLTKSFWQEHLRVYARKLSVHAGEAMLDYFEGVVKDMHRQTWNLTKEEQDAIDWPSVESTFGAPIGVESLELTMRSELIGCLPDCCRYDKLICEDSTKAPAVVIQHVWLLYTAFSGLPDQVLRLQRQFKSLTFRKVTSVPDVQAVCQTFSKEATRCLNVGILPAQMREAASWYRSTFTPCSANAEWSDFMLSHRFAFQVSKWEKQENSSIDDWRRVVESVKLCSRMIVTIFGIRPDDLRPLPMSLFPLEDSETGATGAQGIYAIADGGGKGGGKGGGVAAGGAAGGPTPSPERAARKGKTLCSFYPSKFGCRLGKICVIAVDEGGAGQYHDQECLKGFSGCLNCGDTRPVDQGGHTTGNCFRPGGQAYNRSKCVNELKNNAKIKKYISMLPEQTSPKKVYALATRSAGADQGESA